MTTTKFVDWSNTIAMTSVHVTNRDGVVIYNRLFDDGSNVMKFEGGFGFVTKDSLRDGEKINDGWPDTETAGTQ